jgi:hypothetical protein
VRFLLVVALLTACGHRREPRPDAAPLGEDPARRLTVTECSIAIDHAIELLAHHELSDELKTGRDAHVTACVQTGTLRDYRCLMASRDLTELGRCPLPAGDADPAPRP